MSDPYKVLGVSPNATDKEIKAAYKELVKKYHPDQYQDSPVAEVAQEKMAEVNAAYDAINQMRKNGGAYSSADSYSYSNAGSNAGNNFNSYEIRRLIQSGEVTNADSMLNAVPNEYRNAEWYFLKGSVCYSRGWLGEAINNFNRACQLDPNNYEYRAALNQMTGNRTAYTQNPQYQDYQRQRQMNNSMNCCANLLCADCCCECMGGDLIPCC